MKAMHKRHFDEMKAARDSLDRQINPILTDTQKAKLEKQRTNHPRPPFGPGPEEMEPPPPPGK